MQKLFVMGKIGKSVRLRKVAVVLIVLSSSAPFMGQSGALSGSFSGNELPVLDESYIRETVPTKGLVKHTDLREADVTWQKRVWRTIDLREKLNHPLYYPVEPQSNRRSLWDVIKFGVLEEGSITIYEPTDPFGNADDQFRFPVLAPNGNTSDSNYIERLESFFFEVEDVVKLTEEGEEALNDDGEPIMMPYKTARLADEIIEYRLKEDWFFDKERGVMERRIIGMAPVIYSKDENGDIRGKKTLFWLYFPQCRYVFQNFEVYNRKNDAQRMSFDDLFWKHMYSSYITKVSNVENSSINQKYEGVEALLESERIKKQINLTEHDMWHL